MALFGCFNINAPELFGRRPGEATRWGEAGGAMSKKVPKKRPPPVSDTGGGGGIGALDFLRRSSAPFRQFLGVDAAMILAERRRVSLNLAGSPPAR